MAKADWEPQAGPGQYMHLGTGAWLEDSRQQRIDRWSMTVDHPTLDKDAVAYFPTRPEAELFHDLLAARAIGELLRP